MTWLSPGRGFHAARTAWRLAIVIAMCVAVLPPVGVRSRSGPGGAWAVTELASGRTLAESRGDILDTPVQPGSLMKIVTLAAALESGVITATTTLTCARRVRYGGRVLDCVHPDLHRPLTPVDALAHSCNAFFVQVARRLELARVPAMAEALGLAPVVTGSDRVLLALGIGEYRVPARRWVRAMSSVVAGVGITESTRRVVAEGLRLSADAGTASALDSSWRALAKTGTAAMPGGGVEGLAVVLTPAEAPRYGAVAVAPGAAGRDAILIAQEALRQVVRVGASHPGEHTSAWQLDPGGRPALAGPAPSGDSIRVRRAVADGRIELREMGLEEYVAEALTGEAEPGAPRVALEALAIVVRTFALANSGRHRAEGFDLCDLTHCQVLRPATREARAAAEATAGERLEWAGVPARVHYSASCGGVSERAPEVWPGARGAEMPFLVSRPDPAGNEAIEVRWSAELAVDDIVSVLRAAGTRGGRLEGMAVVDRTTSGRARTLQVAGFSPAFISADTFRTVTGRLLGWQHLKSTLFEIEATSRGYRFNGRGHGHGVGLCVRGATAMASAGRPVAEILAAYFPGTTIRGAHESVHGRASNASRPEPSSTAPGPSAHLPQSASAVLAPKPQARPTSEPDTRCSLRLVLPAEQEPLRSRLSSEICEAMISVASRLQVMAPDSLTVRFHPTVQSYQRATHRPWWTAATTRGASIELLPPGVLFARGSLARTLRHELVHVVTAPTLGDRPLWIQEGLAEFIVTPGERPPDSTTCPTDADLRVAKSARVLAGLYARASACVGRMLRGGKNWREL